MRSDESGGDGVRCSIKAKGEVEVRSRKRLDVFVSKVVWNCGEQWVNNSFRPSTLYGSFPECLIPKGLNTCMAVASGPAGPVLAGPVFTVIFETAHAQIMNNE